MRGRTSLSECIYAWTEALILDKLVGRDSPGPFFKWMFRVPILYYQFGLGWIVGSFILLLTTKGRKTGKLHRTPLEYLYDRQNDRYRIAAGWGGKTDWYRNLRADPHVSVQVGRRKFEALAEPASNEEVGHYMMEVSQKHPSMDKVWNRWSDRPVDGTFESYVHAAMFFPSVWLRPAGTESEESV
jgi:deazaflavin-dependent oxidoreductase (nitroreductase family)